MINNDHQIYIIISLSDAVLTPAGGIKRQRSDDGGIRCSSILLDSCSAGHGQVAAGEGYIYNG